MKFGFCRQSRRFRFGLVWGKQRVGMLSITRLRRQAGRYACTITVWHIPCEAICDAEVVCMLGFLDRDRDHGTIEPEDETVGARLSSSMMTYSQDVDDVLGQQHIDEIDLVASGLDGFPTIPTSDSDGHDGDDEPEFEDSFGDDDTVLDRDDEDFFDESDEFDAQGDVFQKETVDPDDESHYQDDDTDSIDYSDI
jgi:hypothetical protein